MKEKINGSVLNFGYLAKKAHKYSSHITLAVILCSLFAACLIFNEVSHATQNVKSQIHHAKESILMTSLMEDQSKKIESLSEMVISMKEYIDQRHEEMNKQNLIIEFLIKKLKDADAWPPTGSPFEERSKRGLEA